MLQNKWSMMVALVRSQSQLPVTLTMKRSVVTCRMKVTTTMKNRTRHLLLHLLTVCVVSLMHWQMPKAHAQDVADFQSIISRAKAEVFPALVFAQPVPRMGISPDRYQITFDERGGETQSLMVQNLSAEPLTVTLSVSNWDLDENNKVRVIPPTENSIDGWVVINPLRITIPPGTPQTVRWAIMPRLKPEDGEHRAIIFIEEELPERGLEHKLSP